MRTLTKKPILDQQLELEFGEDYKAVVKSAEKFINKISVRPWFRSQRERVFNNEGGIDAMVRHALTFVIEKGDLDEGLTAYSRYLNEEYNFTNNRNKLHHTKVMVLEEVPLDIQAAESRNEEDISLGVDKVTSGQSPLGDSSLYPPGEGIKYPLRPLVEQGLLKSDDEIELFTALANVNNNLREAASLVGMSMEEARRIWWRVYRRGTRASPPRPSP